MPDNLNLLPPERRRALRLRYFARLGASVAYLAVALIVMAGVLFAPTLVFLHATRLAAQRQLTALDAALSAHDVSAISARLVALSTNATALIALTNAPSASGVLRRALAVARPGIALSGFTYVPAAPKHPGTLTLSGSASSRGDLRAYQLALEGTPGFAKADLPVSSYAKESDIPFSITVTLSEPSP